MTRALTITAVTVAAVYAGHITLTAAIKASFDVAQWEEQR